MDEDLELSDKHYKRVALRKSSERKDSTPRTNKESSESSRVVLPKIDGESRSPEQSKSSSKVLPMSRFSMTLKRVDSGYDRKLS